jgi:hypothetical protein
MALQDVFLIPLSNVPQVFQIVLAGITYIMTSKWNPAPDAGWVVDIADEDGTALAQNIPLITGADCLEGLQYLGIQGNLYVKTSGANPLNVPTLDNLGVDSNLYFVTSVPNGG